MVLTPHTTQRIKKMKKLIREHLNNKLTELLRKYISSRFKLNITDDLDEGDDETKAFISIDFYDGREYDSYGIQVNREDLKTLNIPNISKDVAIDLLNNGLLETINEDIDEQLGVSLKINNILPIFHEWVYEKIKRKLSRDKDLANYLRAYA